MKWSVARERSRTKTDLSLRDYVDVIISYSLFNDNLSRIVVILQINNYYTHTFNCTTKSVEKYISQ